MKRKDLIKTLEEMGCVLVRHGGSHDWCTNDTTKASQPVPRHSGLNGFSTRSKVRCTRWSRQ